MSWVPHDEAPSVRHEAPEDGTDLLPLLRTLWRLAQRRAAEELAARRERECCSQHSAHTCTGSDSDEPA